MLGISGGEWVWNLMFGRILMGYEILEMEALLKILEKDRLVWVEEASRFLSSKSFLPIISSKAAFAFPFNAVWKSLASVQSLLLACNCELNSNNWPFFKSRNFTIPNILFYFYFIFVFFFP